MSFFPLFSKYKPTDWHSTDVTVELVRNAVSSLTSYLTSHILHHTITKSLGNFYRIKAWGVLGIFLSVQASLRRAYCWRFKFGGNISLKPVTGKLSCTINLESEGENGIGIKAKTVVYIFNPHNFRYNPIKKQPAWWLQAQKMPSDVTKNVSWPLHIVHMKKV